MGNYLTEKAQKDIEEGFKLKREALEILDTINAEWKSDPTSVRCFDLRMVKRTGEILKRLKELGPWG